ncbi:hypothetical protein BU14_0323s0002 [Porphyra umbilicalis]|uniref:Uncharacterized protein n=1 Tax=Porphyra umbilicalis TaxID=2786 RepID=A0A1X6NZ18_PORUM|nr:hypothetical protein BU14_0323s0002 [Porphyra umbilicalis]|eukprot:OSX73858.1 hypothetical protein BU14_0323s0002 [Porphyra umbilicalis]
MAAPAVPLFPMASLDLTAPAAAPPAAASSPSVGGSGKLPVRRVLFDGPAVGPETLYSQTARHVRADHDGGVAQAAASEARRASALRAAIDDLEALYQAVTTADERTRRRLTRAALVCRRPVPAWALPGGKYWPVEAGADDERRMDQLMALGWSPTPAAPASLKAPASPVAVGADPSGAPASACVSGAPAAPVLPEAPAVPAGPDPAPVVASVPVSPPGFPAVPQAAGALGSGGGAGSAAGAGGSGGQHGAGGVPVGAADAGASDGGGRGGAGAGGRDSGGDAGRGGGGRDGSDGGGGGGRGGGGDDGGGGGGGGGWYDGGGGRGGSGGGGGGGGGGDPPFGGPGGGGGPPGPAAPLPVGALFVPASAPPPSWAGPGGFTTYCRRARVWLHTCNLLPSQQGGVLLLALSGLAAECATQLDEDLVCAEAGAAALLAHLAVTFDAPPAVKIERASAELQASRRGSGSVAAYVVRFQSAVARCGRAGVPLPDAYLGGLLLCHSGLSHEQQVVVQVTAAHTAAVPTVPSVAELAAALDRLHGHSSAAESPAMATIHLTADEHQALLAAAQTHGSAAGRTGPIVCWHCHKEGHVRFHCPARKTGTGAAGSPASSETPGPESVAPGSALMASAVGLHPADSPYGPRVLVCTTVAGARVLAADALPAGVAIVDPGATATVVGADWLRAYLGALPSRMRRTAVRRPASVLFRFGDDRTTLAKNHWDIPVVLGGVVRRLGTHVIPGPLPLLLSRPSLRAAEAVLDLTADSLWLKDRHVSIPLVVNSTGHLTINLLPSAAHAALAVSSRRVSRHRSPPRTRSSRSVRAAAAEVTREVAAARRMAAAAAAAQAVAAAAAADNSSAAETAAPTAAAEGTTAVAREAAVTAAAAATAAAPAPAAELPGAAAPQPAPPPAPTRPRARRRAAAARTAVRLDAPSLSGATQAASGVPQPTAPSLAGLAASNLPVTLTHLHRLYAHPGADRLIHLLRAGGLTTPASAAVARQVTAACSTCRSLRPRPARAGVTLPRPTAFNDTVALDLAELPGRGRFLHLVDLGTRLSQCVMVADKEAPTIARAVLERWVCIYGAPRCVLSDPGAEFHNELFRTLAERFNMRVETTAAQSAWSNGVCERHNGIIKHMVLSLAADYPAATFQELLSHACFAKNSLAVHGCATPFQLVTGTMPRLPSVLSDSLPAMQEGHLPTEADLARTLALLADSRAAFSRAEASQSVRRAMNRRVSGDLGRVYSPGDIVRYWSQSQASARRGMHGPATVVSQAGRVVQLRHGAQTVTRNASDVQPFAAPDPLPVPAATTGMVGAALDALRRATRSPAGEAARVVLGVGAGGSDTGVPSASLSGGEALVAWVDGGAARAPADLLPGAASAARDEGWDAAVAYSILVTRREQRRRSEVPVAEAGPEFDAAKAAELLSWLEQGAYVEVPSVGQRVLSTRWVLTLKAASLPGLLPRLKARLCVRGFQDPDKHLIDSASPTVARSTVRLVLALFATMDWVPHSVDVSTAFLQGLPLDRPRPVYVRPPPEALAPDGVVWRLAKCAYGLTDAPRMWYERVRALMRALGASRSAADLGLFILVADGAVILAVAVHVDNFLYGGTVAGVALFERELRAAFSVGPVSTGSFVFTGLSITHFARTGRRAARLWVDQTAYLDSIDDIPVSATRRAAPSAAVTAAELTAYRRATGALLWAAGQTLPHLACGSAVLARHFRHALVSDLVRANLTIAAARRARGLGLRFRPVRGARCLYLYTDSSAVSLRSSAAQTGWAVFLGSTGGATAPAAPSGLPTGVVGDLVSWGSHRQRRVTHSSFAAEAFGLLQGLHAALGVSDVVRLLFSGPGGASVPVHAFIDSRSLYDALTSSARTGSKEVRAAVSDLQDHYRLGSLSSVSWLPGSHQLADSLTKPTGGRSLRAAVASGWLPLPPALVTQSAAAGGAPAWARSATVVPAPATDGWRH